MINKIARTIKIKTSHDAIRHLVAVSSLLLFTGTAAPVWSAAQAHNEFAAIEAEIKTRKVSQDTFDKLQRLLDKYPDNAFAYVLLGKSYDVIGMRDMARDAFARAHKLDPNRSREVLMEFKRKYQGPKPADGFTEWVEIRQVYPQDPDVKEMENIVAMLFQTVAAADAAYVAEQKHNHSLMGVATMMSLKRSSQHKYDEALRLAEADLKLHPKDTNALLAKATALNGLGRFKEAIEVSSGVFEKFPYQGGAAYNLALAYQRSGMPEKALLPALYQLGRADYGDEHVVAVDLVATILKTIKPSVADSVLKTAGEKLDISSFFANYHYGLGEVYQKLGKPVLALEEFKKAVDSDNHNGKWMLTLGQASETVGNYELALQAYMTANSLMPKDEAVLDKLRRLELRIINQQNDLAGRLKNLLRPN